MKLNPRARGAAAAVPTAALLGGGVLGGGVLGVASSAIAAPDPTPTVLTVTALSTGFGSTAGGTNVTITGKGFNRLDEAFKGSVLFGTKPATSFMVVSDTQITAKAPAGTGAKVKVSVTDQEYASADSAADDFSYLDPISVQVPDRTELSAAGGTVVRLTLAGPNLNIGTSTSTFTAKKITATVDGVAAPLTWVDATHVDLTAPAGIATKTGGKVPVVVYHNGVAGPADATHARFDAVVTKLSVVSGKTTGTTGTSAKPALTITGVGLANATGFRFGKVKGTCVAASGKASTTWTCVNIPAGRLGPVSVLPTFSNGTLAGLTSGATYTYSNL